MNEKCKSDAQAFASPAINRIILAAMTVAIIFSSGCTIPEMLVGAFGDHYTGGGQSNNEKRSHVKQQVRQAEAYSKYGASDSVPSPWGDGL